MRKSPTKQIEEFRVTTGMLGTSRLAGANGAFFIPCDGVELKVIVSDGADWKECGLPGCPWEHVSVSARGRCPTWEEMDHVKRIFWRSDETVIQYHVPRSEHISLDDHCLHLWKPVGVEIPKPPMETVAPKEFAGTS